MRSFYLSLVALSALVLTGCPDSSKSPGVHWITLEQLTGSLGSSAPMAVGFDIDDTVLFSSPCFYEGQQKYSPGSNEYLKNMAFWTETNAGCDRYSIPKDVARALIELHQGRGDTLYFVTARPSTEGEQVTAILQQAFGIRNMQPVVFTSGPGKAGFLKERGVHLYYGDSDSDITSAREAGARGIRVMRAANSTNQPLPVNGGLGEEVLVGSDH